MMLNFANSRCLSLTQMLDNELEIVSVGVQPGTVRNCAIIGGLFPLVNI